jgi:hypothetical protein
MATAAAAWAIWAAWADTKIVAAVCDRRRNHERGWKQFRPRFFVCADIVDRITPLAHFSNVKIMFAFGGNAHTNNPALGLKIIGVMIVLIVLIRIMRGGKSN